MSKFSKPFSHVVMDLYREVIGMLGVKENKLCASKQPDQFPLAVDCLRVKKMSTVMRQQSNVTNQNMRLEYLLNKQCYNRNEIPHESLSLYTLNKLASLPGLLALTYRLKIPIYDDKCFTVKILDLNKYETLSRLAPLNVRKVPKTKPKDSYRNIQPDFIPDSSQYKEINLVPVVKKIDLKFEYIYIF